MTEFSNLELLEHYAWTNSMIMQYCGVGANNACRIRKEAIERYNGIYLINMRLVKRDAVLAVLGTSLENELSTRERIALLKKEERK